MNPYVYPAGVFLPTPVRSGTKDFSQEFVVNQASPLANRLVAWYSMESKPVLNRVRHPFEREFNNLNPMGAQELQGGDPQVGIGFTINDTTSGIETSAGGNQLTFANIDDHFSYCVWFTKLAAAAANGSVLFGIGDFGFSGSLGALSARTTGVYRMAVTGLTNVDTANLTVGKTYCAVCSADAGSRLYIDGILIGSGTGTRNTGASSGPYCIAAGAGSSHNPNVIIHDVKVWRRALNAAEAWALFAPATRWELHLQRRALVHSIPVSGNQRIVVASGGIIFSGASPVLRTQIREGAGGILFGGASPVEKEKVVVSVGGILFGGAAPMAARRDTVATGGILFGGATPASRNRSISPDGGMQFSGVAPVLRIQIREGSGGIIFGGAAGYANSSPALVDNRRFFSGFIRARRRVRIF